MGADLFIATETAVPTIDLQIESGALEACDAMDRVAVRLGVRPLLSFLSADPAATEELFEMSDLEPPTDGFPPEEWFAAAEGLITVRALLAALRADPEPTAEEASGPPDPAKPWQWRPDAEELTGELEQIEDVLQQLASAGVRWHLDVST